jgi:hypothetical protein
MRRALLAGSLLAALSGSEAPDTSARAWRTAALNGAVVGGFLAYGVGFWDYGLYRPRGFDEGWFDRGTLHGGVDKLGHAYTNLVTATLFAEVYRAWGWSRSDAAALGAGSSLMATTLIEVGDAFSPAHGFSYQDMVFNAIGCGLAWWRGTYPAVGDWVDFRLEWLPSRAWRSDLRAGTVSDPTTDYAGMTYLLAFSGTGPVRSWGGPDWLRYVEVHVAYRALGFEPGDTRRRERELAWGLGADLGLILRTLGLGLGDAARVPDFFQVAGVRIEPFALNLD